MRQGHPNPRPDGARYRREGVARTGTGGPIVRRPCRVRAVARAAPKRGSTTWGLAQPRDPSASYRGQ
jgi:hypothetical protein